MTHSRIARGGRARPESFRAAARLGHGAV